MVLEQVKEMWTEIPKAGKGIIAYYLVKKCLVEFLLGMAIRRIFGSDSDSYKISVKNPGFSTDCGFLEF